MDTVCVSCSHYYEVQESQFCFLRKCDLSMPLGDVFLSEFGCYKWDNEACEAEKNEDV